MGVGFGTFFPKQCPTVFKVLNCAPRNKRIKIFGLPIRNGYARDLMDIPEVSEADIRHSLLKGELNIKIRCGEIKVIESNINLLQFDECHKQFLMDAGITEGLEVETDAYVISELPFIFKQEIDLIGALDNSNRVFTVPAPDKFIQGTFGNNEFRILIKHNGRDLVEDVNYTVSESGGAGTGFDTITLKFAPKPRGLLRADYVIEHTG